MSTKNISLLAFSIRQTISLSTCRTKMFWNFNVIPSKPLFGSTTWKEALCAMIVTTVFIKPSHLSCVKADKTCQMSFKFKTVTLFIFYPVHPPLIRIICPYQCLQLEINKIIHTNIVDEHVPTIFLCSTAIIHESWSELAATSFSKWQMIIVKSSINHGQLDFGVWRTKALSLYVNQSYWWNRTICFTAFETTKSKWHPNF